MGRRDRRSNCPGNRPRISFARRRTGAHQRERHADSISSKSLERASAGREKHRRESEKSASRIRFMPQVPIIMPQLGESIAEATIVDIKVKPGDEVAPDQEIMDVETNKAVMGVTTPCKGKIDKITAQLKETYPIGTVLGYIEASEADAARFTRQAPPQAQTEVAEEIPAPAGQEVAPARQEKVARPDGDGPRPGGF